MTIYFPLVVHGELLIELTKSESRQSLDAFIQLMRYLVKKTQAGDADIFHAALVNAPRGRFDETEAARPPILRWRPDDEISAVAKQSAG